MFGPTDFQVPQRPFRLGQLVGFLAHLAKYGQVDVRVPQMGSSNEKWLGFTISRYFEVTYSEIYKVHIYIYIILYYNIYIYCIIYIYICIYIYMYIVAVKKWMQFRNL